MVYSPCKNKEGIVSEAAAWVMKRSASGKAGTVEPQPPPAASMLALATQ